MTRPYRRLTWEEVEAIRADKRRSREVAKDYPPISHVAIWNVQTGRSWNKEAKTVEVSK